MTDQQRELHRERILFCCLNRQKSFFFTLKRRYCLIFVQSREKETETKCRHKDSHLDNLPTHSSTCSYEYDGVLLLVIIITVMVIINNLSYGVMFFYLVEFKCLLFLDN